jgi:hypothetical protein
MKFITLLTFLFSITLKTSKKVSSHSEKSKKVKALGRLGKGKSKKQFNPTAQLTNMVGPSAFTYGYGTSDHTLSDYVVINTIIINRD